MSTSKRDPSLDIMSSTFFLYVPSSPLPLVYMSGYARDTKNARRNTLTLARLIADGAH
jgi:hypothetical protein